MSTSQSMWMPELSSSITGSLLSVWKTLRLLSGERWIGILDPHQSDFLSGVTLPVCNCHSYEMWRKHIKYLWQIGSNFRHSVWWWRLTSAGLACSAEIRGVNTTLLTRPNYWERNGSLSTFKDFWIDSNTEFPVGTGYTVTGALQPGTAAQCNQEPNVAQSSRIQQNRYGLHNLQHAQWWEYFSVKWITLSTTYTISCVHVLRPDDSDVNEV